MWTRAQLKDKARVALKKNYWKMVLIALLITFLAGGSGSAGALSGTNTSDSDYEDGFNYGDDFGYEDDYNELEDILGDDLGMSQDEYEGMIGDLTSDPSSVFVFLGIFLFLFAIIFVVILGISLLYSAFIVGPMEVGINRFFVKTLDEPAEVKEVAYAFDHSYKNVVKVMFFKTLYTLLWMLLFIIPGFIKAYEYRMIPYLLAENPNLTKEQAFALSKQMMMGQKWSAFVLDMSFIGWHLLSICTLGMLDIFYVAPYVHATNAALYEELSSAYGRPAQNTYVTAPYQPVNPYEAVYTAPAEKSDVQEIYTEE